MVNHFKKCFLLILLSSLCSCSLRHGADTSGLKTPSVISAQVVPKNRHYSSTFGSRYSGRFFAANLPKFGDQAKEQLNQSFTSNSKSIVEEFEYPSVVPIKHPVVDKFVREFTENKRAFIEDTLPRRAEYLPQIEAIFSKYGLPKELINVAFIESRFLPDARSPDGETIGMWQFTKTTARSYGLKVGTRVDERIDVEKSTEAAARHLADLFSIFGEWHLVLAAYNSGVGRVTRALNISGNTDVFKLVAQGLIPVTTGNYLARFSAITKVLRSPESYGFPDSKAVVLMRKVDRRG